MKREKTVYCLGQNWTMYRIACGSLFGGGGGEGGWIIVIQLLTVASELFIKRG